MEDYTQNVATNTLEGKVGQLRNRFGISDVEALKLLQQHNEDLEKVTSLMSSNVKLGAVETESVAASSQVAQSAGGDDGGDDGGAVGHRTGSEQDPIDLTKDGTGSSDQDMQKALLLSMQELQSTSNGVISLEEQELSRALEASLRENNANMSKSDILALFQDPKNPHKRKRIDTTPVGLKNIGNTCWFSAVIQSLYHISAFRREILGYIPPPLSNGATHYPQCVTFVLELQKIFALLLKSNKMYIDPSPAIQSLQEAFSKEHSHTGAQQDVSEFTHKLLEWIEYAFGLTNPSKSGNPIIKLFNGHYKTEGINNDKPFINKSEVGAYPIQVRGHTHLHNSLESATFDTEMGQKTFFTLFPPILVLELSRFQFNHVTKQVEKVHDQMNFDLELYVDRYLEENKKESIKRKMEVDKLRNKIRELNTRLERYIRYDEKPIPITDVLSMTLAFVHDKTTSWEQEDPKGEEEAAEKRPRTSLYPSPRYKSEQELETLEKCLERWTEEMSQDMEDLRASIVASEASLSAIYSDSLMKKTPYHLHAVMVHQGEASGGHYWVYTLKHPTLSAPTGTVEMQDSSKVLEGERRDGQLEGVDCEGGRGGGGGEEIGGDGRELKEQAHLNYHTQLETGEMCSDAVSESMSAGVGAEMGGGGGGEMSTSSSMSGVSSTSASTVVLSGVQSASVSITRGGENMEVERPPSPSAPSSPGGGCVWMKFNDVMVTDVSWEEVQRESLGGASGNTSAYCLVYINSDLHEDWLNRATPPPLSGPLLKFVEESNTSFAKELVEYSKNIESASHIHTDLTRGSEGRPPSPSAVMMSPAALRSLAAPSESALPAGPRQEERSPQELMQIDSPPPLPVSPGLQKKLVSLISSHKYKTQQLINEYEEPRLLSLFSYALHSGFSDKILRLLALDEIALCHNEDKIKMLAKREYIHSLSSITQDQNNPLSILKDSYRKFVKLGWFFVQSTKMAQDGNFTETLHLTLKASHLHKSISRPEISLQPNHFKLLCSLKCHALQEVSSKAYSMFEQGDVSTGIQIANTLIVPALVQLTEENYLEREVVLEKVREEWCQCLNRPDLDECEQDQLGDLLTRILDDSGKTPSFPNIQDSSDVDIALDELDSHTTHTALTRDLSACIRQLLSSSNPFFGI